MFKHPQERIMKQMNDERVMNEWRLIILELLMEIRTA
jgi:hypothetical protein